MLSIDHLRKSFFHRPVLADISFSITSGEAVGLLGKNGTGKSTLLRILAGLSSADAGHISFDDIPIQSNQPESRREMLYLGHAPGLYPGLSARENLAFAYRIYAQGDYNFSPDSVLKDVGLLRQADDPIKVFSQGMLQRLKLALAKAIDWKLLLFDEPFAGLDLQGRSLTQSFFDDCKSPERSLLLVVHDLEWALDHCSRIILLEKGKILADQINDGNTRDEILHLYKSIMA